jgi:dCTP deaminase
MLVDFEIRDLCLRGALVPYEEQYLNPASIDIRIGYSLKREAKPMEKLWPWLRGKPVPEWIDVDLTGYSESNPYWVKPKEFVLVASLETFHLPPTITGEFRLKSSSARVGWNNLLAMHLDPGWNNSLLTMELVNERRFKRLKLWPGQRIGQALFTPCSTPERSYAITGRYNNDHQVEGAK